MKINLEYKEFLLTTNIYNWFHKETLTFNDSSVRCRFRDRAAVLNLSLSFTDVLSFRHPHCHSSPSRLPFRPIIVIHKSPPSHRTHNTVYYDARIVSERNRCQMRLVTYAAACAFRASRLVFEPPVYGQSARVMRTPRDPVTDWGSRRRRSAAVTRGDTAN